MRHMRTVIDEACIVTLKGYEFIVNPKFIILTTLFFTILNSNPAFSQDSERPIILTPQNRTIVQKSFLWLDGEKKTLCAAVGEPDRVHYAIDLSDGAIVKIWKGDFLDVTTMWTGRGEEQLAYPLGKKILTLRSSKPYLFSDNENEEHTGNEFSYKGYTLDKLGSPSFIYTTKNLKVKDRIWSEKTNTQRLNRKLVFSYQDGPSPGERFRLAQGDSIEKLKKNKYSIDGNSYVIEIGSKLTSEPTIRRTESGYDLIISITDIKDNTELDYSILW